MDSAPGLQQCFVDWSLPAPLKILRFEDFLAYQVTQQVATVHVDDHQTLQHHPLGGIQRPTHQLSQHIKSVHHLQMDILQLALWLGSTEAVHTILVEQYLALHKTCKQQTSELCVLLMFFV